MTRFCPDCGKQINDASGCICKMGKKLKGWMPENKYKDEALSAIPEVYAEGSIAGAKAALEYLHHKMYYHVDSEIVEQMLKELEGMK